MVGYHDFACQEILKNESPLTAISFFEKKFKPIGACAGYKIAGSFLAGHFIPAPFLNEFSSFPATYLLNFFKFLFMVRLLHKLGDADCRLTRQDRLFGHLLGSPESCPSPHAKPRIIAMTAPQIRPQTLYLIFPAVSGFIWYPPLILYYYGYQPKSICSSGQIKVIISEATRAPFEYFHQSNILRCKGKIELTLSWRTALIG